MGAWRGMCNGAGSENEGKSADAWRGMCYGAGQIWQESVRGDARRGIG